MSVSEILAAFTPREGFPVCSETTKVLVDRRRPQPSKTTNPRGFRLR